MVFIFLDILLYSSDKWLSSGVPSRNNKFTNITLYLYRSYTMLASEKN